MTSATAYQNTTTRAYRDREDSASATTRRCRSDASSTLWHSACSAIRRNGNTDDSVQDQDLGQVYALRPRIPHIGIGEKPTTAPPSTSGFVMARSAEVLELAARPREWRVVEDATMTSPGVAENETRRARPVSSNLETAPQSWHGPEPTLSQRLPLLRNVEGDDERNTGSRCQDAAAGVWALKLVGWGRPSRSKELLRSRTKVCLVLKAPLAAWLGRFKRYI